MTQFWILRKGKRLEYYKAIPNQVDQNHFSPSTIKYSDGFLGIFRFLPETKVNWQLIFTT
jgi:hypothetical protein